jgi:hypothetical protein
MDRIPTSEDIRRVNNGHSLFAPSSSKMHSTCLASLLLNFGIVDPGSPDAAYGTVGHEIGEQWLKSLLSQYDLLLGHPSEEEIDAAAPDRLGEIVYIPIQKAPDDQEPTRFHDVVVDEEMYMHVRRYVAWCINLDGEHYVETRVDISRLTPIPDQGGTADHAAIIYNQRKLVITDLKMGIGEAVYPAYDLDDPRAMIDGKPNGNTQAMEYALGFVWEHGLDADPEFTVEIRIAQPRRDYFGVWTTTVAELLVFAEWVTERYRLAWSLDAPRTASLDGCRWCKVKASCGSWLVMWNEMTDDVFDPVIEGEFREVTSEEVSSAGREIALKLETGRDLSPDHHSLTTHQMEIIKLWRPAFEHFFAAIDTELLHRARDGEKLLIWKRVPGRLGRRKLKDGIKDDLDYIGVPEEDQTVRVPKTPVQLEDYLRKKYGLTKKQAAGILEDVTTRDPGQDTLARLADERGELDDLGSVFDAEPDVDDL